MDLEWEKNQKFLQLVQKHQQRFDKMGYEFYDLDTPSLDKPIEQATFVFEVLEIHHLLETNTNISHIKEYLSRPFKQGVIDGFTFLRDGAPYYIGLTNKKPEQYNIVPFRKTENPTIMEEENQLIEIFELFQRGNSLYQLEK